MNFSDFVVWFESVAMPVADLLTWQSLVTFGQVVLIDIALAADNAVVIALAASGLPLRERRHAIFWGIVAATVMRIGLALVTVSLLEIVGLVLAGGLLLLWVCWKMWVEMHPEGLSFLRHGRGHTQAAHEAGHEAIAHAAPPAKTLRQAVFHIVLADLSMSLDNVLAVAGAAREHPVALVFGLALSIAMMGFAAMLIARLLQRFKWIAYVGLGIVFFVAVRMIWDGAHEVIGLAAANGLGF